MKAKSLNDYYQDFNYSGREIVWFEETSTHFEIALVDGSNINYLPKNEDFDGFKKWLLSHDTLDITTSSPN